MKEAAEKYAADEVERLLPYWRLGPESCVMLITPDVARGWLVSAFFQGAIEVLNEESKRIKADAIPPGWVTP